MPINSKNVLVGTPDQLTTGAVLSAPLSADAPESALDTLTEFTDAGYISEDGVELAPDYSTTDVKDWSGATVRRILDAFTGTLTWAYLETNEQVLKEWFGNASKKVATATTGTQLTAALGADERERKSWAFKIKDGTRKVLIYVPDGQITSLDSVAFKKEAVTWPVTLTTYPDSAGKNIYIMIDDGVFAA